MVKRNTYTAWFTIAALSVLVPCDRFPFHEIKLALEGKRFDDMEVEKTLGVIIV